MKKMLSVSLLGLFTLMASAQKEASIAKGKKVYAQFCVACHQTTGAGIPGAFPPLAKSDYLMKNTVKSIRGIKYGLKGEITVNGKKYNSFMPPPGLSDQEVVDVMNYIQNSWGNKSKKMVTLTQVKAIKKQ